MYLSLYLSSLSLLSDTRWPAQLDSLTLAAIPPITCPAATRLRASRASTEASHDRPMCIGSETSSQLRRDGYSSVSRGSTRARGVLAMDWA